VCLLYIRLDYFRTPFLDMVYCWLYSFYWAIINMFWVFSMLKVEEPNWISFVFCYAEWEITIKRLRMCILLGLLLWNQNHGSNLCYPNILLYPYFLTNSNCMNIFKELVLGSSGIFVSTWTFYYPSEQLLFKRYQCSQLWTLQWHYFLLSNGFLSK
jgi:hypothetical protein